MSIAHSALSFLQVAVAPRKVQSDFDNSNRPYLAPLPIYTSKMMARVKRKASPIAERKRREKVRKQRAQTIDLALVRPSDIPRPLLSGRSDYSRAPKVVKVPVVKQPRVKSPKISYQERRELEADRLCSENGY